MCCSGPPLRSPAPKWTMWLDASLPGASRPHPTRCDRRSREKRDDGMIAVDTNVLIHLLTGDDPAQQAAARSLFENERIWIARTVLLETAWVPRSLYGFEESAIRSALIKLLGLPKVQVEDSPAVASALALTAKGLEFADALHLTSRPDGAAFASFDRSFVKRATRAGVTNIRSIVAST